MGSMDSTTPVVKVCVIFAYTGPGNIICGKDTRLSNRLVSDRDGEAIYNQLSALVPTIRTAHEELQAKKSAFMDLLPHLHAR